MSKLSKKAKIVFGFIACIAVLSGCGAGDPADRNMPQVDNNPIVYESNTTNEVEIVKENSELSQVEVIFEQSEEALISLADFDTNISETQSEDTVREIPEETVSKEQTVIQEEVVAQEQPIEADIHTVSYILNTNTKKFHKPGCSSVDQMKEKNKKESNDDRATIIGQGYDPCKKCKP